jgi:hypothetical protein
MRKCVCVRVCTRVCARVCVCLYVFIYIHTFRYITFLNAVNVTISKIEMMNKKSHRMYINMKITNGLQSIR